VSIKIRFHERETVAFGGSVPTELTEVVAPGHRTMKGMIGQGRPRCAALDGTVGEWTACKIYEGRPSSCRDFGPSWENGVRNEYCDVARDAHGLPALRPEDWE
jgi:Fe-S-cluster containining protein